MPAPLSNVGIISIGLKTLVLNKFAPVMGIPAVDSNIVLYPKKIAMREVSEKRGKDTTNFISLWSSVYGSDWARRRGPLGSQGVEVSYTDGGKTQLNVVTAVPAKLKYEITFWTTSLDTLLALFEEYLYWPDNSPTLNMSFNSNPLNFQIVDFGDMTEDSGIEEKFEKGQMYVYSVPITIDGWLPRFQLDWTVQKIYTTIYDANATPPIQVFQEIDVPSSTRIYA